MDLCSSQHGVRKIASLVVGPVAGICTDGEQGAAFSISSTGFSATSAEPKVGQTTQKNVCVRRFARAKMGMRWGGKSHGLGGQSPGLCLIHGLTE